MMHRRSAIATILFCCLLGAAIQTSMADEAEDEKTFLLKKLIALKLKSKKKVVNPIAPPPPVVPTGPVTPPPPPPRECIRDIDCPPENPFCFQGQCVECLTTSDCPSDEVCVDGVCLPQVSCGGQTTPAAADAFCRSLPGNLNVCVNDVCVRCRETEPTGCNPSQVCVNGERCQGAPSQGRRLSY